MEMMLSEFLVFHFNLVAEIKNLSLERRSRIPSKFLPGMDV
jgi:hypothetical protein